MKILNLFYSMTSNTKIVAERISKDIESLGHSLDLMQLTTKDLSLDLLNYDMFFIGSGVYEWLPGKPMQEVFAKWRKHYVEQGAILPSSPRLTGKKAVIYCTYGGAHTGINEAIPAVKYMGQLFDHLGIEIIGEWYFVGEYHPERLKPFSSNGRLGNIEGRPNENDLNEVSERVKGILQAL
ncbi:MAG TPA: hypothetical protein VKN82_07115 [Desulfohalobiaceae bacterium]|nr:hypothetical protein [Desulfohalobiaceae bacterium]